MGRTLDIYLREQTARKMGVTDPSTLKFESGGVDDRIHQTKADSENQLVKKYIEEVENQNKEYFEQKARDLLEMRKHDPVSLATANLLFKSLNINMEQYILKLQKLNNQQKKAGASEET